MLAGKPLYRRAIWLTALGLLAGGGNFFGIERTAAQSADANLKKFEKTEVHMGAPFKIVFYCGDEKAANGAFERCFARIKELDRVLSDYDLESETSRLVAGAPHDAPVRVSQDLFDVLTLSKGIAAKTGGAFDVTVGPLTKQWRRARRQKELPAKEDLARELQAVGMDGVELSRDAKGEGYSVLLKKPGMRLDFGGIGQGYAADEVLKILKSLGITRAMVNASGDVVALDPPPGEKGWKAALTGIHPKEEPPTEFIWLANAAVTASGDAYQFVEIDGKRYSHIVDPKTGMGVERRIAATVYAPTGATADALATAMCVLETERGLEILKRDFPGAEALVVEQKAGEVSRRVSEGFPARERIGEK